MITIKKDYHFHAAHRNELLDDKCRNIHGHTYQLEVFFEPPAAGPDGVTCLFSNFDDIVMPLINLLDHAFIIHRKDPLLKLLMDNMKIVKLSRFYIMDFPTSAENLAAEILEYVANQCPTGTKVVAISLKETTSSTVIKTNQNEYIPGNL